MAAEIVITVGSASANSYNTLAEATLYFESRVGGERWPASDTDAATRALLTAMRSFRGLPYIGQRLSGVQALDFPRTAVRPNERNAPGGLRSGLETLSSSDGGLYDKSGAFWAGTVIPTPVKEAHCEIAFAMHLDAALNDPLLIQAVLRTGRLTIDHTRPSAVRLRFAIEALRPLLMRGAQLERA